MYDDWPRLPTNTEPAVEFLATVAGPGPGLELGIGTCRIALPLLERVHRVIGEDVALITVLDPALS